MKRNDSGEYLIKLNNKFFLECKVTEKIKINEFEQIITTDFKSSEFIEIKSARLIDKKTKEILGFRIFPFSFNMFPGDNLSINWNLSMVVE